MDPSPTAPRRVFTAPVSSPPRTAAASTQSAESVVETLYNHPSVKIVAFTAAARPTSNGAGKGLAAPDVEPGSLSWTSQLERTIAVGEWRRMDAAPALGWVKTWLTRHVQVPFAYTERRARWLSSAADPRFSLYCRKVNVGASTRPRASLCSRYAGLSIGE